MQGCINDSVCLYPDSWSHGREGSGLNLITLRTPSPSPVIMPRNGRDFLNPVLRRGFSCLWVYCFSLKSGNLFTDLDIILSFQSVCLETTRTGIMRVYRWGSPWHMSAELDLAAHLNCLYLFKKHTHAGICKKTGLRSSVENCKYNWCCLFFFF